MKKQLFLFIFVTFLISCKNFNVPVRAYFEKYTTQAVIQKNELDGTYPRNAAGIECFDSQKDHYITLYLSNPLKFTAYDLQFCYEFDNPYINSYLTIHSDISPCDFISVSEDNCIWQLVFNKDFLYIVDSGAITGENNQIVKDISGNIRYNPNKNIPITQDEYESYRIDLSANTSPLRVKNAKIENGTDNFNLTFEIQNLLNPIHKIDTNGLTIQKNNNSKKHWDITNATNGMVFSDVDGTSSLTTSASGENIQITFNTEISNDSGEGFGYTIIVEDSFGLKSSVYIEKDKGSINPPIIKYNGMEIEPSTNFKTDSNRDGMCHLTIEDISGFSETPYICYTYSNGSNEETNTVKAPAELLLPCGDNYTINAYAFLDGYQDSESVNKNDVDVKRDSIYYVADYGNDNSPTESNGSKEKPYRTIQHCINEVKGNIIARNGSFNNDNIYGFDFEYNVDITINLLTNITPDNSSVEENSSISENSSLILTDFPSNFTIQSADNSYKTIDAQKKGIVIRFEGEGTKNLKNLNITNGKTDSSCLDGGGILVSDNGITLNLENVNIYNNEALQSGGGIFIKDSTLKLTNVNIYGNKAQAGGGIYVLDSTCNFYSGSVHNNKAIINPEILYTEGFYEQGMGGGIVVSLENTNTGLSLGDSNGGVVEIINNEQVSKGGVYLNTKSGGTPRIAISNAIIKNNKSENDGVSKQENLYICDKIDMSVGASENRFDSFDIKISVSNISSKSEIGITTAKKPNNTKLITFTNDLPSTITPSDVFFSDEGYIVNKINGKASLMQSGFFGDLESLSSVGINLKINDTTYVSNMTVSGSGNLDLDFTGSTSTINSVVLTDLNGNEITLTSGTNKWNTASLPPDKYIIKIEFEYEGILYNYLLPFTYVKS